MCSEKRPNTNSRGIGIVGVQVGKNCVLIARGVGGGGRLASKLLFSFLFLTMKTKALETCAYTVKVK